MPEITGSFRVRDARAAGMTAAQLASARFAAPFHGVRSLVPPDGHVALCRAYKAKMRADAAFTALSAARIWGMPLPLGLDDDLVYVSTPHGMPRPRGRGVRGSEHDASTTDIVRVDGLPVLAPVDAWLTLAGFVSFGHLVAAADYLVAVPFGSHEAPLATLEQLRAAASRPRVRGGPILRRASAWAAVGVLSPAESSGRVLLVSGGVPAPVANLRISPLVVLDWAWPDARFGSDYLGDHHRSPTQFARDVERRSVIRDLGWGHLEVTRDDLYRHPHQFVFRVRSRLGERGIRLGPLHPSRLILPTP